MKRSHVVVLFLAVAVTASYADETNLTLTVNGVTYSNVVFGSVTPSSVSIRHSSGIERISLSNLPPELQKRFGYDSQKDAEFRRATAEVRRQNMEKEEIQRQVDSTAIPVSVKIVQATRDGALANGWQISTVTNTYETVQQEAGSESRGFNGKGGMKAVTTVRKTSTRVEQKQTHLGLIFIRGLTDVDDGGGWRGLIWYEGKYEYTTVQRAYKRIDQYSVTPDRVVDRLVKRTPKGDGNDSTAQTVANNVPVGSGTGFLITTGKNPCVLTAHHVVGKAKAIKIVTGGKVFLARIVGEDSANDIAVLQITVAATEQNGDATAQQALPIASSRQVELGNPVFTIGFPNTQVQGVEPKLTRGEINSLAGIQDDPRYFQTSVAVQPGNSGGPLVDMQGNVIGIITMRLNDLKTLRQTGSLPQNVNYGLKSSFVLAFLDSVKALGEPLPPARTEERKFEDVVKEVQQATVLVLSY